MKQGSTGLTIRELQTSTQSIVGHSPKQVNLWIEQLAVTNLGESSRAVYRLLLDLNQSILEPDARCSILKIIEPVAQRLVNGLDHQFINNHISLSDKQKKIAALVQALQAEVAIGYHTLIESIVIGDVKRGNKKLLTRALGTAIKYHGLVVLRCYQLYASVPNRVWRELYILYQLARSHQIQATTFKTQEGKTSLTHSAKDCFARILLLSMANPYQFRQVEIELLWQLLGDYTALCGIEIHAFIKHPYVIDLNSDQPPVQKSLYRKKENENCLKISVAAIIEQIKLDITHIQSDGRENTRRVMLFKHLIQRWGQGTHRGFARTNCNEKIQATIGLGATHFLLSESRQLHESPANDDDLQTSPASETLDVMEGSLKNMTLSVVKNERTDEATKSDRNYLSSSAVTSKDVWAKLYQPSQVGEMSEQKMFGQEIPEQEKPLVQRSRDSIVRDSYKIQQCDLINMSPSGYCLQISSSNLPKHTQTGEIIGFIEGDLANQHWSIGIVRWVRRQAKTNQVQIGVQLLAPDILPISVQLRNSQGGKNSFHRALLLPALTGVGQAATIITNPLAFNINNKVRVTEAFNQYEVRLTKEINSSASSRQFCFDKLTAAHERKRQPTHIIDQNDIDGVWDLI